MMSESKSWYGNVRLRNYITPDPGIRIHGFRVLEASSDRGDGLEILWSRGAVRQKTRVIRFSERPNPRPNSSVNEGGSQGNYESAGAEEIDDAAFEAWLSGDYTPFIKEDEVFSALGETMAESSDMFYWGTDIMPLEGMSVSDTLYCVLSACCLYLRIEGQLPNPEESGRVFLPEEVDKAISEEDLGISEIRLGEKYIGIYWYSTIGFGAYYLQKLTPAFPGYDDEPLDDAYDYDADDIPAIPENNGTVKAYWDSDSEFMDRSRRPKFIKMLIRCFCQNYVKELR